MIKIFVGMLKYENLTSKTLKTGGVKGANPTNGRLLLPVKLGITDECQHVNHEIKVIPIADVKKAIVAVRFFFSVVSFGEQQKKS